MRFGGYGLSKRQNSVCNWQCKRVRPQHLSSCPILAVLKTWLTSMAGNASL